MTISANDYAALADAKEVEISTSSGGRDYSTIIWVVDVDDALHVRSFLGDRGRWYGRALAHPNVSLATAQVHADFTAVLVTDRTVIDTVSEAFIAKYPSGRSRDAMVAETVLHTTLRLNPA